MFGSPVRQGLSPGPALTSPPLQHRGPAFVNPDIGKENVDTEVLPGSPMVSGAGTSGAELLRAKSTVMQEQARLKRFKMLLDQVEQEVNDKQQQRRKRRDRPSSQSTTPRKGTRETNGAVLPFDQSSDEEATPSRPSAPTTPRQTAKRPAHGAETPRTRLSNVVSAWHEKETFEASPATDARPQTPSAPRLVVVRSAEAPAGEPSALRQVQVAQADAPVAHSPVRESPRLAPTLEAGNLHASPSSSATDVLLPAPTPFRTLGASRLVRVGAAPRHGEGEGENEGEGEGEARSAGGSSGYQSEGGESSGSSGCGAVQDEVVIQMEDAGEFLELGSEHATVDMDMLRTACAYGNLERTAALLRQGQDINGVDSEGRTALMYAVYCERHECAQLLVNQGARLDQQANDGSTAMHRAAFCGSARMLQLLVDSGANHLVRDEEGRIPLHWAAHNAHISCLSALVKKVKPSGINAQDDAGMTPAMWAAYYNMPDHLGKLLRNGASLGAVDGDGKTVLHWTVSGSGTSCLRQLLTFENSGVRDAKAKSVLHCAAEAGSVKACKFILGVRPSAVRDLDVNDRTPLHWAAACGKARVLRALMKRGADVDALDNTGRTAKEYAEQQEFSHCVAVLNHEHLHGLPATDVPAERPRDIPTDGGPSAAVLEVVSMLTRGSYAGKYTAKGRGPAHQRYFWVDAYTGELCWLRSPSDFSKNPSATQAHAIVGAAAGASAAVRGRRDYDPSGKHRFAFTVSAGERILDLVAPDENHMRMWVDGLNCLVAFGAQPLVEALADAQASGSTA